MAQFSKKEGARLDRELKHLQQNFAGVENMATLPDVMFVIDPNAELIAVREARRMGIPVVAIVDTNCDPDLVDWVIPGNDDALRAIRLFTSKISDAVLAGRQSFEQSQIADQKAAEGAPGEEGVEYVDTSAYEVYEKQEGDFVEGEPAVVAEEACGGCREEAVPARERDESSPQIAQRRTARGCPAQPASDAKSSEKELSASMATAPDPGKRNIRATREGIARPHRRGIHRLPRSAGRIRRRYRAGHRHSAQEGPGRRAKKGAARHVRGPGRLLHSRRRQNRRAGGSELRERFRRAHRGFSASVPRRGHAHRRHSIRASSAARK